MMHPEYEILGADEDGDESLHTGRVVPIYEAAGKITTRVFRVLLDRVLANVPPVEDSLPRHILQRLKLPGAWDAIRQLHFPPQDSDLRLLNAFRSPAQFRLIFEEFFWLECGLELKRAKARLDPGVGFELSDRVRERIKEMLPFKPTGAQKRVLGDIARDMAAPHPMYRLLQGDVGSGENAGGGGSGDHRHRERVPGGAARAHGDSGGTARVFLQEAFSEAGIYGGVADGIEYGS